MAEAEKIEPAVDKKEPVRCSKCGISFKRLLLLAMLQDAGAHCHPGSDAPCPKGGEHEFA